MSAPAPLRIAAILRALPGGSGRGGVSYQVHHLATRLATREHHVTLFSLDAAPQGAPYDVRRIEAPVEGRERRAFLYYGFPRLVAGQDFRGFDVIHAHGDDAFLPRGAAPVVRTFWGSDLGEALADLRPGPLLGHLAGYAGELVSAIRADRTVAISEATRKALPFVHEVVPPGVDLGLFRPGDEKAARPTILFVAGTLGGRKRFALLDTAFRDHVRPAFPDAELRVVCPERVEGPGVTWLGRLGIDETGMGALVHEYQSAWVFCLPSSYEGFGLPYVEAMATGTAVVATPNPGAREITEDGASGLLAEPRELGTALVRCLRDHAFRDELAARGLTRAQVYDFAGIVTRYEAILREAAARGRQ